MSQYVFSNDMTRPWRMRPAEVSRHLRAMIHCTCRIDSHCLGELKILEVAAKTQRLTRLQVLRRLRGVARCPCYVASHCIETLCELIDDLSAALREERQNRRVA